MAELDYLSVHPARLLSDVLPLPPSHVAILAHRRRAASGTRHRVRDARRFGARGGASRGAGAMTAVPGIAKSSKSSLGDFITAALIVIIPIALAAVCFAARLHMIELSHTVRAELLFAMLLALMASGMPISI